MKKIVFFLLINILILSGCNTEILEQELNQYYLSVISSNRTNTGGKNYVFDFKTNQTIKSNNVKFETQYGIMVYDNESDRILYTSYCEQTDCVNVYFYNPEDQSSTFVNTQFNAVNHIIPREDDFIILANPIGEREICLYKMDKNTYELQEIALSDTKYDDMSSWNIFYIPQTDEVVIQAYSESEQWDLTDKLNKEHHTLEELKKSGIPYYFYIYGEGNEAEYLFKYEMPQPYDMVSNGVDILFEINGMDEVYRYNIETKELSKEKVLKRLDGVFYMSNNGKYLYQISGDNKIVRVDYNNKETIELSYNFNIHDGTGCILLKKQQ